MQKKKSLNYEKQNPITIQLRYSMRLFFFMKKVPRKYRKIFAIYLESSDLNGKGCFHEQVESATKWKL